MWIKNLKDCKEIIAGDKTVLRELLNPNKEELKANYSIAYAYVKPGEKAALHRLKSSEVYYIFEGRGVMHVEEEAENVSKGQVVYVPPGAKQYIKNEGNINLEFLCIVDPAWKLEDEEVLIPKPHW